MSYRTPLAGSVRAASPDSPPQEAHGSEAEAGDVIGGEAATQGAAYVELG